jgi:hypothetical protein
METNVDNETLCEKPHWAAAVDGYTFRRGQRGRIVARCMVCKGGFTVTEANAEAVRGMMIIHRTAHTERGAERGLRRMRAAIAASGAYPSANFP